MDRENTLFDKLLSAQVDIKKRLTISNRGAFVSDGFLTELYNILLFNRNQRQILERLQKLLSTYKYSLETIRWELTYIPTPLIVSKHHRNIYDRAEEFIGLKTQDGSYEFSLRSAYCPDYVPELDKRTDGEPVWCLCSEQQARNLERSITPCWSKTDSLVDWIRELLHPTQLTDTQRTPKELIYHYIQSHSDMTTADILSQKFAGRSRTFKILKDLERDNKIEKKQHGIYNTV